MRKLALTALFVGALGFAACGGGEDDDDGGINAGDTTGDATGMDATGMDATGMDDTGMVGVCNPVAQTGCDAEEKCAQEAVTINEGEANEMSFFRTACVADGTVAVGAACVRGPDGVDDCAAGGECFGGSCVASCDNPSTVCIGDANCNVFSNVFTEFEGTVGICEPLCDPFAHETLADGMPSGTACPGVAGDDAADPPVAELVGMCVGDIGHPAGAGACGLQTPDNEDRTQNSLCQAPDETGLVCFASGCAKGYTTGSFGENPFNPGDRNWCLGMCNPLASHSGQVAADNGRFGDQNLAHCKNDNTPGSLTSLGSVDNSVVPADAEYACRYRWVGDGQGGITSSTSLGLCYPVVGDGIGSDCSSVDLETYVLGWFTEEGTGCQDDPLDPDTFNIDTCPLGCVSIEDVEAFLEDNMPAARVKRNVNGTLVMRQDLLERYYPENAAAMDYPISSL